MPIVKKQIEFIHEDNYILYPDTLGNVFLFEELMLLLKWHPYKPEIDTYQG